MEHCDQCGADLPAGAVFCPVGADDCPMIERRDPDQRGAVARVSGGDLTSAGNDTTAAIDVGELDPTAAVEGAPTPGLGSGILVVVRGPNAGSRFLLDRDVTTIGRHPDSHVFLDDVTVSRHHAEVRREGDRLVLHDMGSLNGTYVAGERVDDLVLTTGNEVQVGRFKMAFVASDEPAADE